MFRELLEPKTSPPQLVAMSFAIDLVVLFLAANYQAFCMSIACANRGLKLFMALFTRVDRNQSFPNLSTSHSGKLRKLLSGPSL